MDSKLASPSKALGGVSYRVPGPDPAQIQVVEHDDHGGMAPGLVFLGSKRCTPAAQRGAESRRSDYWYTSGMPSALSSICSRRHTWR